MKNSLLIIERSHALLLFYVLIRSFNKQNVIRFLVYELSSSMVNFVLTRTTAPVRLMDIDLFKEKQYFSWTSRAKCLCTDYEGPSWPRNCYYIYRMMSSCFYLQTDRSISRTSRAGSVSTAAPSRPRSGGGTGQATTSARVRTVPQNEWHEQAPD